MALASLVATVFQGPKKSRFSGLPLSMALEMYFPLSRLLLPAPYKKQVHETGLIDKKWQISDNVVPSEAKIYSPIKIFFLQNLNISA